LDINAEKYQFYYTRMTRGLSSLQPSSTVLVTAQPYRRHHRAKYRRRRSLSSLSCAAAAAKKGETVFSHTCAAGRGQLLRIDFAGDTAAPAGRVNIDARTSPRFVCTSGPKRKQFVQRQHDR